MIAADKCGNRGSEGSVFPKATLLLHPPSLQGPPPTRGPISLPPSWHLLSSGVPGSEALDNKDIRSYHIHVFPEWMGKRPREEKELPKLTQQNKTWAKGCCASTLPVSLE